MWIDDFKKCELCAWSCRVNRLRKSGACRVNLPEVAYLNMSYATRSITVTMLGCCFRCIYCNAYRLSQYPDVGWFYKGFLNPESLTSEVMKLYGSEKSRMLNIGSLSFTGGEPTIHWPYIREVISLAKEKLDNIKVGIATNGFSKRFRDILNKVDWINFEVKAFDDEVHRAITGAPVEVVLGNLKILVKDFSEKIRVVRTVVIPKINETQVLKIAEFLASINPEVPYRLIAYRPNFITYYHPGPSKKLMKNLVKEAKKAGMKNVSFSGWYPYKCRIKAEKVFAYKSEEARIAAKYAMAAGCMHHPRDCGNCKLMQKCPAMVMEPWYIKI
ncbi:MAG: radical SAM protein [Candidatus Bathyarchaeota archaeon]|nr:radical SAM protein [Candidatus Bathyarchaeota archaeon]